MLKLEAIYTEEELMEFAKRDLINKFTQYHQGKIKITPFDTTAGRRYLLIWEPFLEQ